MLPFIEMIREVYVVSNRGAPVMLLNLRRVRSVLGDP